MGLEFQEIQEQWPLTGYRSDSTRVIGFRPSSCSQA